MFNMRACRIRQFVLALILVFSFLPALVASPSEKALALQKQGKIESKVLQDLEQNGDATFFVVMKEQADTSFAANISDWNERGEAVVQALQEVANRTQAPILENLAASGVETTSFWIVNAIEVKTRSEEIITSLASRPEVAYIKADETWQIPEPIQGSQEPKIDAVEWNVAKIRAPEVWQQFNDRGEGIVVANIDTGVMYNHPAVVMQYRGRRPDGTFDHNYNWFDPSRVCGNPSLVPCDNNGHGTHTMGTMVGDDGGANQIGVAPRAKWIAAKGCESSSCSFDALLRSGQWVLAPTNLQGQNPRPDLRPNVVNNSWGGSGSDPFYRNTVIAWRNAGIFPAFANGNPGSACGNVSAPGSYPESFGVGATDINDNIAGFSGRGPSPFGNAIKPNASAPGVNVRSSWNNGSYVVISGTSMATPHVAAVVALMWSASPGLKGNIPQTTDALQRNALVRRDAQCGPPGGGPPNNVYGWGRIDAFRTVQEVARGGDLVGRVTDRANGRPIANARVEAQGTDRSTETDANGNYRLRLLAGTYNVTASAFGFSPQTVNGVRIIEGQTTTQNFALQSAPRFRLSGTVSSERTGGPLAGAEVRILDTPIAPVRTNAQGFYDFGSTVPAGQYRVQATSGRCIAPATAQVTVNGNTVQNFRLAHREDAYGYSCDDTVASNWMPGTDLLPLIGRAVCMEIPLPFPVRFYGQSHTRAFVSSSGFITFQPEFCNSPFHTPIPNPAPPNAAIYALWDDLFVARPGGVYTRTLGTAPNRKFIVEWRDVQFCCIQPPIVTFEIVLDEATGEIATQYNRTSGQPRGRGSNATIGIENHSGTIALQYSFNEQAVDVGKAIKYSLFNFGLVQGRITDSTDGLPVAGAQIRSRQSGRSATTGADGSYLLDLRAGDHTLEISAQFYDPITDQVQITANGKVTRDYVLDSGRALTKPLSLEFILTPDRTKSRTLTITNSGTSNTTFEIKQAGGRRISSPESAQEPELNPNYDPNSSTTEGMFLKGGPRDDVSIAATGDVLRQWRPTGLSLAWGVGYTSNVWLSDVPNAKTNTEFPVTGPPRLRQWPTPWAGAWGGDMALDTRRNLMCQVNVGGDNGVYCWDMNNGNVVYSITGSFPWTQTSQRGLAYRSDNDTFYIGGWNQGIVFNIKGRSWDRPGEVISQCTPAPDGFARNISGLTWNEAFDVLWVATNSPDDLIFALNPRTCAEIARLRHPSSTQFDGAGLETDEAGNLWMIKQGTRGGGNIVFLVDSGIPAFTNVPWLSQNPSTGSIAPGQSLDVNVTVNTRDLSPGVYTAFLFILSNDPRNPRQRIDVKLIVPAYQQGVNVAGDEVYIDSDDDPWDVDQQYTIDSGFGYINGNSQVIFNDDPVDGTDDPDLYFKARENPLEYRFDVPISGRYQVELRFAEWEFNAPGQRMFDVVIGRSVMLPAYDIYLEAGRLYADEYSFIRNDIDGQIRVRLIPSGFGQPIISAIRVTHRPDNPPVTDPMSLDPLPE